MEKFFKIGRNTYSSKLTFKDYKQLVQNGTEKEYEQLTGNKIKKVDKPVFKKDKKEGFK